MALGDKNNPKLAIPFFYKNGKWYSTLFNAIKGFARVAFSGDYNDLTNKPPIPTLDTSNMVVFKKIYEYVVDDFDKGQELIKEIPIDFNKYRKIIIDAHYEATNGSVQRWDLIQPIVKNPPMTLAKCWQVGIQHGQASRAVAVRELDQVLAVWTVANNASSYHLEMM